MSGPFDIAALATVLGVVALCVGAGWKLALHLYKRVGEAETKASAGDARLHRRIDELAAGTISRDEMVQHLDAIKDNVGEVRDDIRSLHTGMESLANAVIAGRGKVGAL
jgi:hypothetical protein